MINRKRKLSKSERIKVVFDEILVKVTKKEIIELCSDISNVTVERALNDLMKKDFCISLLFILIWI